MQGPGEHIEHQLIDAVGVSCFAVATFIDIRGFSSYMETVDSAEAAVLLKAFYLRMMADHYAEDGFHKFTGDGLLVVSEYDESNVVERCQTAVRTALRLVDEFPTMFDDDAMIDFDVPDRIGIGIARGACACLLSGTRRLDYAGRPLNLAARLMDLARPQGVVLDAADFEPVLGPVLSEPFRSTWAPVRGVKGGSTQVLTTASGQESAGDGP